jgi:peptide/nickel transport system ATP-binding protein
MRTVTLAEQPLLRVEDLHVSFDSPAGRLVAVNGVALEIGRGERVAVVGESGSGKSVTALAVTRLIQYRGGIIDPSSGIWFDGADVTRMPPAQMRALRGREIGMIFQDHQAALNPVQRIGNQIAEALRLHGITASRREARDRTVALLEKVGLDRPRERVDSYPHELSGGMRQRVMIAMMLAPEPRLLIADEPTTALDALIQQQIVALLRELTSSMDLALLMVSHDLRLVASFVDRIYVMYAGSIVESGTVAEVFHHPQHQYTRALLDALPSMEQSRSSSLRVIGGSAPSIAARPSGCAFHPRCSRNDGSPCVSTPPALKTTGYGSHRYACHHPGPPPGAAAHLSPLDGRATGTRAERREPAWEGGQLLEVRDLCHKYPGRHSVESEFAVENVSFSIRRGESFGLVGESGSGKSTVARCVARLVEPAKGRILFDGDDLLRLSPRRMRATRRRIQVVFQDPRSSLDSRMRVRDLLAEPMRIFKTWGSPGSDEQRLVELAELVGLSRTDLGKYPHEFSGGQLQRVAIARALALSPDLVVCDEPVSSLDASVSAQIINLLTELRTTLGLTYLFIGHDLSLVRHFCDHVGVMQAGRLVESAACAALFAEPKHPYTRKLLAAQPDEPRGSKVGAGA